VAKLVLVRWLDAKDADDTWVSERDALAFADAEVEVSSVGWLVSRGPKYLTLAGDRSPADATYGRVCKIPTSMLVSCVDLTEPET